MRSVWKFYDDLDLAPSDPSRTRAYREPLSARFREKGTTRSVDPNVKKLLHLLNRTNKQRRRQRLVDAKKRYNFKLRFKKYYHVFYVMLFIGKLRYNVKKIQKGFVNYATILHHRKQVISNFMATRLEYQCKTFDELEEVLTHDPAHQRSHKEINNFIEMLLDKSTLTNRSDDEIEFIRFWFSTRIMPRINFFKENFTSTHFLRENAAKLREAASKLVLQRLEQNEVLFKQGDIADAMYIVLEGRISVWLCNEKRVQGGKIEIQDGTVFTMRGRKSFFRGTRNNYFFRCADPITEGGIVGELGLMSDNEANRIRKATIKADDISVLVKVDRSVYCSLLQSILMNDDQAVANSKFFRKISMWNKLGKDVMYQMCRVTKRIEFKKDQILIPFERNMLDRKKRFHFTMDLDVDAVDARKELQEIYWVQSGSISVMAPKWKYRNKSFKSEMKKAHSDSAQQHSIKNPHRFFSQFHRICGRDANQMVGADRLLIYLHTDRRFKKNYQEFLKTQFMIVASSDVVVQRMYVKNFIQFALKTKNMSKFVEAILAQEQFIHQRYQSLLEQERVTKKKRVRATKKLKVDCKRYCLIEPKFTQ